VFLNHHLFDERISVRALRGKTKGFAQLSGDVVFGRNTLKLRLKRLTAQLVCEGENGL
jgi:hypothetical protein